MSEDNFVLYGRLVVVLYAVAMTVIVALNFTGVIKMSWFWVFSPLWVLIALFAVGLLGYVIIVSVKYFYSKWRKK